MRRPGIYSDISNTDYHADKDDSYSSSIIKKMDVPALAKHALDSPSEYKDCFRIGSAIHSFILEPEKFHSEFLTGINCARRSAADKQKWADWYEQNGQENADQFVFDNPAATWHGEFERMTGKSIVTPDELLEIESMALSVQRNDNARELLENGKAEQSCYVIDEVTGLKLRVRPDYMNDDFICDLKTIDSVENFKIDRAIVNFGYDIQAAMYTDVVQQITGKFKPFLFIFVSKCNPHLVRVISLSDASAESGWDKYMGLKRKFKECLDSKEWPGVPDDLDHTLFERAA